jgi:Ca2+-binding EF-hand superfamily protein
MNSHKSVFGKKDEKDLELHEVFRILDNGGTGRVTVQALYKFMSEFEASFDEEQAFELVKQFDSNGNGDLCFEGKSIQSGVVVYERLSD